MMGSAASSSSTSSSKKKKGRSRKIYPKKGNSNNHSNDIFGIFHGNVSMVNESKIFAGCVMILLNVGSKFISIKFSKSTEEYLKMNVTKELLVFAMAWMGTRDIVAALTLTLLFTLFSDFLLNEESFACIVPLDQRFGLLSSEEDDKVTEEELSGAIAVLEKAKLHVSKERVKNYRRERGGA